MTSGPPPAGVILTTLQALSGLVKTIRSSAPSKVAVGGVGGVDGAEAMGGESVLEADGGCPIDGVDFSMSHG